MSVEVYDLTKDREFLATDNAALVADILATGRPFKILGGYKVVPRKISELPVLKVVGIRAKLSSISRYHIPLQAYYKCPVCGTEYVRKYTMFLGIAEMLAKRGRYITDRCPACGSTAYLVPDKSTLMDVYHGYAHDGTGIVRVVIPWFVFEPYLYADLTGIFITYGGMHHVFVVLGMEPAVADINVDVVQLHRIIHGANPLQVVAALATLVKPNPDEYILAVAYPNNLSSFSQFAKVARAVGAHIGKKTKTANPTTPAVLMADNYMDLIKSATHTGPNNLIVVVPPNLYKYSKTLDADVTITFDNTFVVDVDVVVPLLLRAMYKDKAEGHKIYASVNKILPWLRPNVNLKDIVI